MSEHGHLWKLSFHIDGCHFYASTYSCDCGARRTSTGERDIKKDPYSMAWMGEGDDACERCVELLSGALPKYTDEIDLPA